MTNVTLIGIDNYNKHMIQIEVWHDLIPLRYEFTPGWYGYVLLQITSPEAIPSKQDKVF